MDHQHLKATSQGAPIPFAQALDLLCQIGPVQLRGLAGRQGGSLLLRPFEKIGM
jgi:hypothetical protein